MKKICFFVLLTFLILTLTWVSAAEMLSRDLNENIVRLHIIANSDSPEDQALKLSVRDALLAAADKTKEPLEDDAILSVCTAEIKAQGFTYPVSIERGQFYFPKKEYENLTLPAGDYNAVRIIIGDGAGENWWCIMYPPLCFAGSLSGLPQEGYEQLQMALNPATLSAICESEKITVKPSFKLLELWQTFKSR